MIFLVYWAGPWKITSGNATYTNAICASRAVNRSCAILPPPARIRHEDCDMRASLTHRGMQFGTSYTCIRLYQKRSLDKLDPQDKSGEFQLIVVAIRESQRRRHVGNATKDTRRNTLWYVPGRYTTLHRYIGAYARPCIYDDSRDRSAVKCTAILAHLRPLAGSSALTLGIYYSIVATVQWRDAMPSWCSHMFAISPQRDQHAKILGSTISCFYATVPQFIPVVSLFITEQSWTSGIRYVCGRYSWNIIYVMENNLNTIFDKLIILPEASLTILIYL